MFVWPHGIYIIDRDGNVWVTDSRAPSADDLKKFPGEDKKGSVVVKFTPDGKVLMTLGKPDVKGNPPEALTDPWQWNLYRKFGALAQTQNERHHRNWVGGVLMIPPLGWCYGVKGVLGHPSCHATRG